MKKQKVKHEIHDAVGNEDNNLKATISDGPVLTSLMSVMDCNRRSKLWLTGDRDYMEHAFVEGGPQAEQKLYEILMQNGHKDT